MCVCVCKDTSEIQCDEQVVMCRKYRRHAAKRRTERARERSRKWPENERNFAFTFAWHWQIICVITNTYMHIFPLNCSFGWVFFLSPTSCTRLGAVAFAAVVTDGGIHFYSFALPWKFLVFARARFAERECGRLWATNEPAGWNESETSSNVSRLNSIILNAVHFLNHIISNGWTTRLPFAFEKHDECDVFELKLRRRAAALTLPPVRARSCVCLCEMCKNTPFATIATASAKASTK